MISEHLDGRDFKMERAEITTLKVDPPEFNGLKIFPAGAPDCGHTVKYCKVWDGK